MSLEYVEPGERREHPHRSEAPPFYWQRDNFGATASGTTDRRVFIPGQGAITPDVQLWVKEGGAWRRLAHTLERDRFLALRCMAIMEADIMDRYLADLNRWSGK